MSVVPIVIRLGELLHFWQFSKPVAIIILPKSPKLLSKFCKVVKIYPFSSEIIYGQLLQTYGDFYWSHTKSFFYLNANRLYCTFTTRQFVSNFSSLYNNKKPIKYNFLVWDLLIKLFGYLSTSINRVMIR